MGPPSPLPDAVQGRAAPEFDWPRLAAELGIEPRAPLAVALSGGADSVYLLDALRRARPAPALCALHVNHGLRGAESGADEKFCRALCARWRVPFEALRVKLELTTSNLEERARLARYRALGRAALAREVHVVVTAHQRDDVLETLLMRWMRGSAPAGMLGPAPRSPFPVALKPGARLELLRPLLAFDGEALRSSLERRQIPWREDHSNRSPRFTRNRVRHGLLPLLRDCCGEQVIDDLQAFQGALARHEELLEGLGYEIPWKPQARAGRPAFACARDALCGVATPLLERALHRSLLARTRHAPRRHVSAGLGQALAAETNAHWNLRGAWGLKLDSKVLWLLAPLP